MVVCNVKGKGAPNWWWSAMLKVKGGLTGGGLQC